MRTLRNIWPGNNFQCLTAPTILRVTGGDSASGEDEFNEGYLDSVYKHNYYKKQMCRFGSQCWRPHCWFRHGNGDRMKHIVKIAQYWTQEVKRLSASTVATDPALQVWEQMNVQEIPSTQVVERIQKQNDDTIPQECEQHAIEQNVCMSVPTVRHVQGILGSQVVERIQKQIVEPVPQERDQRTDGQSARVSFPTVRQQRNVQEIPGTQVVERIQKQIFEKIPQERVQRTVDQNACVSVPTVQEQVVVQEIPELQVVEQILEQAVEAMQVRLLERLQQRTAEQSERLFGRLEEIHKEFQKRLDMSEARRAENDVLIKEIGELWTEKKRRERGYLNGSVLEPIPEHP